MHKPLAALALFAISAPALADDPSFSLGTGFDYSRGKYGSRLSTDILYVPVTAKYEFDDGFFKLTVPYISITGPGGVVRGVGLVRPNNTRTFRTTNSGLGDITASAGHMVYSRDALSLDLVGNVKFGTADANKGLGTGKNDYSAQFDGYYTQGQATLFATAGYKIYGSPVGVTLRNTPYGTLGLSEKLSDMESAGIMLDVAKSPSAASGDQREVTLFVSQKTSANTKVQFNILKGFASGSPNVGIGAMVTGNF
jgi:hypothetical protein